MIEIKNLVELSMSDLVAYYNANKALKEYYANEAQMNVCYKNTKEKEKFDVPVNKQMKCNVVESEIMDEFEKRLIGE